jgi:hypothetical protein
MMSWFSKLMGADKVTDNVLDKDNGLLTQVGGWIGGMNFTPEEQAEMNERMVAGVGKFVEMTLGENTERSKTRRAVAVMWIKAQLAMILIVFIVAPFDMELAKFYLTIAFGTLMVGGTLSIIAFFFGGHMLSSHLGMSGNKKD